MSRFTAAETAISRAFEPSAAIGTYERLAKASEKMLEDVTALVQGGSSKAIVAPDIVRSWDEIRRTEPLDAPGVSLGFANLTKEARSYGRLIFGADSGLKLVEMPKGLALEHEMDLKLTAAHMKLLTEDMSAAGFDARHLIATAPTAQATDFLQGATRGAYAFVTGDKAAWNQTSQYMFDHYGPFVSTNPAHLTRLLEYQVLDTPIKKI